MFDTKKTFQCPNCQKYINNTMTSCRFCSTPLDAETIAAEVAGQEKLNDAFSSANSLRLAAGALPTFLIIGFIPFLGFFAGIGHILVLIGLPFLIIYWQLKYGSITTADKDYQLAKKYWKQSLGIWGFFAVVQALLILLNFLQ